MSASHSEQSAAGLTNLTVPKASDVLADRLRSQIFSGELAAGEQLPRERVLAETTRLSRGSVRDALRALEVEGLVFTRPGRSGGTFVRRPDASTFERNLEILLGGHGVRLETLADARQVVEPGAAAAAAQHRTDADLERIEGLYHQMVDAIDNAPAFCALNTEWHVAVVDATHNEMIKAYVASLWRALGRYLVDQASAASKEMFQNTLDAHCAIFEAIRDQDRNRAFAAMSNHARQFGEDALDTGIAEQLNPPIGVDLVEQPSRAPAKSGRIRC